jgi:hypothetical protein
LSSAQRNKHALPELTHLSSAQRNKYALPELTHLSSAQQKHLRLQTHVHCYLQLILFAKQKKVHIFLDRLMLRRFIGAVCYLADQDLHFRGHKYK